ncbi:MAG: autotransporter-associated beta strand repeat-containing protein [Candidatus Accumulibacter sp.]|nr:autotransporter-associated beta strand repeat-containing protein [Accumulibacter sp.]
MDKGYQNGGYVSSGLGLAPDPYTVKATSLDTGIAGDTVKLNVLTMHDTSAGPGETNYALYFKFDGNIGGSGGLEVNLPTGYDSPSGYQNALILAGDNTYTGLTTVREGVLRIGSGSHFSFPETNNVTLSGIRSILVFDIDVTDSGLNGGTGIFRYDGVISGGGSGVAHDSFVKTGTGTLILTHEQDYTGRTLVEGGTLQIGNGSSGFGNTFGEVLVNSSSSSSPTGTGGKLVIDSEDAITFARIQSTTCATCTVVKENINTVTLEQMALSGLTQVKAGTLVLGDGRAVTAATLANGKIEIDGGARLVFNFASNADITRSTNSARNISGAGELVKEGSGTLVLQQNNSGFTGNVTINEGTLRFHGANGQIASTASVSVADGATLAFSRTGNASADFAISGAGNLRQQGNSGTSLTLSRADITYTGETIVASGNLILANTATGFASSALRLGGGSAAQFTDQTASGHAWNRISVTGQNAYTGTLNASGANLDFVIPASMSAGQTMLTVTGDANIGGSTFNVVVAPGSGLGMGSSVKLVDVSGNLTGEPLNDTSLGYADPSSSQAAGTMGALVGLSFKVQKVGGAIQATVDGAQIRPEAKSLSEGHLSGTAALTRSSDFIASHGIAAARAQLARSYGADDDGKDIPEKGLWGTGLQPFYAHSAGRIRHETGSHITTQGYNFIAGAVAGFRTGAGEAMAGAFFEYGKGEYDTYNSFASGKVVGDGNTHHRGFGFFGRVDVKDGYYVEGSLRRGKVDTKYQSDSLRDYFGTRAGYTSNTAYTGAHIGAGKVWQLKGLSDKLSLDTYGQALWTRQDADTVTLSTGERVSFSSVSSERLKAGARVRYDFTSRAAAYVGFAYDHEFGAKVNAKLDGFSGGKIDAPKLSGGTGVAEVGFLVTPTASSPLAVDFGVQGYAGKREGVTGNVRLNYYF